MDLFIKYLIVINIIAFLTFGIDKWKAVNKKWRIKESTLLFISLIFGAFGALMGMFIFRHKVNKLKFKLMVPLMLLLELAFIAIRFIV